jgi:S-adenosylmethionine:tRNA ribosyltransferase-isomerase
LHFGEELLRALDQAGHQRAFVTLHVGPGTFAPLGVDDLHDHPMHAEHYSVPAETASAIAAARLDGRQVVAVGTTVVRTLEASLRKHGVVTAGADSTNLFLFPPTQIRAVDSLVTNFHLPRSTLLALVMAFAGIEPTRAAYRAAVDAQYRFFSYGDAMLIRGTT